MKLSTAARNAMCNAGVDLLDGGTGNGTTTIYQGTRPTNIDDASTANPLGTCPFTNNPAFGNAGAVNPGEAEDTGVTSDTDADNSGTATHFRMRAGAAGDTAALFEGTCGQGSGELDFDNNVIVATGTIAITQILMTMPAGS